MKKTSIQFSVILFVSLASGMLQNVHAQWVTNGNNATGASSSTPNEFVGTLNNFNLNFKTNSLASSTAKMTLTTNGDLGIGIIPSGNGNRLDVVGGNVNTSGVYKVKNFQVITATSAGMRLGGSSLKVGIGTTVPVTKLQIVGGTDADLATGGYITLGEITSENIVIDNNELMARNNGAVANLAINNNGGNVGIGTASPVGKLHIKSPAGINANLLLDRGASSDSSLISFRTAGGEVWRLGTVAAVGGTFFQDFVLNNVSGPSFGPAITVLRSNSNIGIGTGAPGERLVVFNGTTTGSYTVNGWATSSDARLKTNIAPIENALAKIMQINGVTYNWKNFPNEKNQIGFIAQDVEKVFPEVIVKDKDGNYAMVSQNLTAPIIEAIKELQKQLDDKDMQISALNERMQQFETSLQQHGIIPEQKSDNSLTSKGKATLEQNEPNPFSSKTIIRYFLPANAKKSFIKIYLTDGVEIASFPLVSNGNGSITLSANTLSAGTYTYILWVDGKSIDSKQLILLQ